MHVFVSSVSEIKVYIYIKKIKLFIFICPEYLKVKLLVFKFYRHHITNY